MDLLGKLKLLPKGHQYAVTLINMLTNYSWCILLFTKDAHETVYAHLVKVYSKFSRLHNLC